MDSHIVNYLSSTLQLPHLLSKAAVARANWWS